MTTDFNFDIAATVSGNQMLDITTALHNQADREIAKAQNTLEEKVRFTDGLPQIALTLKWDDTRLKNEYSAALKTEKWARLSIDIVRNKWNEIFLALSLSVRV
jgi:hypothetical protein